MKDALYTPTPTPVIWQEICGALGKSLPLLRPSLVCAWRLRSGAVGERLKMFRGLFKFMVWRGKSECITSLPTRLPEVCKILVKAVRGVSALHHIAAHGNARAQGRGGEKASLFSPWTLGEKKGDRVSWEARILLNQSFPNIRGFSITAT